MARTVEHIEFTPDAAGAVLARMDELCAAHDGWINLLPGVPDERAVPEARGPLASLFGPGQPPVTMATFVPPSAKGRRGDVATVGLMHPTGARALPTLRALGISLPPGWQVRQDHVRRGLIVLVPPDTAAAEVLAWILESATALCAEEMTGTWRADVHLPNPPAGG